METRNIPVAPRGIGRATAGESFLGRLIERARSNVMVRQGMVVFAATMLVNVAGFVFHAIASRRLGVDAYGMLYALISASSSIATLPAALLAPVIMRFAAEFRALHDDAHVRRLCWDVGRGFTALGLLYMVVGVVAARPIAGFFHVPVWTIPLAAAIAAAILVSNTLRAAAQGTQDFNGYAFSVCSEGVLKIVGLALLVSILSTMGGLLAGLLGFLSGLVAGLAVIVWRLVHRYAGARSLTVHYDWRRIALSGAGAAAATIGMTVMMSGDVVLVKHYFSQSEAGIYGAAALGGKMLLYFVSFAPTVLLPQATDRHVRGQRTRGVMFGTLGLIAVLGACALAIMKIYGLVVLHVLVGHAYDAAAPLLVWYATAMAFFAATSLLTSYGIATHRLTFAVPLLLCAFATMGGIVAFHSSLEAVMRAFVAGNALTAVVVGIAIAVQGARSLRAS
jgi:O-antigen/teichoic acid export membrane protein